jgi:drug/metabolite transporter (DMT)-like permease
MSWIILAILANFFWALGNVADKYIVGNRVKNPYVYQVWLVLFSVVYILLIPFINFMIPDWFVFGWLFVAGGLYLGGSLFYIKAMQLEDVTRINIWLNLVPIFSMFLAWVFLGELLTKLEFIAFGLLIFGAIIASIRIKQRYIVFSKGFYLMMVASLCFALYGVIIRQLGDIINQISIFIWLNVLMIPAVFFLFFNKIFRKDFFLETKKIKKNFIGLLFSILLLGDLALLFSIGALTSGPVALVFAMQAWQIIFVFIIAMILTLFNPHLLREDITLKNVAIKLMSLIVIICGIIFLNLN